MILWLCAAAALQDGPAGPRLEPVAIDPAPEHVAAVDLDRDGARELLSVRERAISLPRPDGSALSVEIPGSATIWTVADHDGDGRDDLLALVDGRELVALRLAADPEPAGGEPARGPLLFWSEPLFRGLSERVQLPRGARPADFCRDLDGDGRADLLLPQGDRLALWFGTPEGFERGPELAAAARLSYQAGPERGEGLLSRVSRRVLVPPVRMRDISGDGRADLLTSDGLLLRQYIRGAAGLPAEPTVTVDLGRFEAMLPELKFDAANVAALARYGVLHNWADLNRDGAQDLLVMVGGTVLVFTGGPGGLETRRPRDQLKAHGNVVYALATPVDRDEIPDLVLLRVEDVSLARLLTWLVFSFSVKVDVLCYRGLGDGRFDKRPLPAPLTKTVAIDSPSLLRLYRERDRADALRRTVVRLADLDGDGRRTDLAVLDDRGGLRAYRDVVPDPSVLDQVSARFIRDLLQRDRALELDVQTLTGWMLGRSSLLFSLAQGREPAFALPPPADWEAPQAMAAADLDGDGRDELLLLRRVVVDLPAEGDAPERRRARLVGWLVDP